MDKTSDTIRRAYKVRLKETVLQRAFFGRCCGLSRVAYNWALEQRIKHYKATGKTLPVRDLHKRWRASRAVDRPWALELPDRVSEQAIRNLDTAYKHFFRRVKAGGPPGFPKFKARRPGYGSFQVILYARHITDDAIALPKIGRVRLQQRDYLTPGVGTGAITATVSERAGKWFVSVQVEVPRPPSCAGDRAVAVHLGVRHTAVTRDETGERRFHNPKALEMNLKRMKRLQRQLSRKTRGGGNYKRLRKRIQRLHERIVNLRQDNIHRVTTEITRDMRAATVAVETWPVRDMMMKAPHWLARYMADVAFGEAARQLAYKCDWRGVGLVRLETGFPSTKRCSECGAVNPAITLETRRFWCDECGYRADRETNAARNVWLETTGKPPERQAPGDAGSSTGSMNGESSQRVDDIGLDRAEVA